MKVLLDTNALVYLLDPRTPRSTRERLQGLLEDIERTRGQLLIPTLVLSEYLVVAGRAGRPLLDALRKNRWVVVVPFDVVAAEECAAMQADAMARGNKRYPLGRNVAWQKVKVDRQLVAIAKSRGCVILSDDDDVRSLGPAAGVIVNTVASLPIPSWALQLPLVELPAQEEGLSRGSPVPR